MNWQDPVMKFTKKNIRISVGIALAVLLITLLVQNSAVVTLRLLVWQMQIPAFGVVLLSAVIGFAIGWLLKSRKS